MLPNHETCCIVAPSVLAEIVFLAYIELFVPVTFNIYTRDVYGKCNDLYSNSGIWTMGGTVELNVKATALTRGVAHLPGDFLGTYSFVAGNSQITSAIASDTR